MRDFWSLKPVDLYRCRHFILLVYCVWYRKMARIKSFKNQVSTIDNLLIISS